jgi:hypothetical protein
MSETRIDEDKGGAGSALRERADLFAAAFADAVRRLFRPVRPVAAPVFTLFAGWAEWGCAVILGLALVLAGMAYVDPVIQGARYLMSPGQAQFFQWVTDIGKSGWVLIPSGVAILAILAVMPPVRSFADRLVLAFCARLAFVFLAVGGISRSSARCTSSSRAGSRPMPASPRAIRRRPLRSPCRLLSCFPAGAGRCWPSPRWSPSAASGSTRTISPTSSSARSGAPGSP